MSATEKTHNNTTKDILVRLYELENSSEYTKIYALLSEAISEIIRLKVQIARLTGKYCPTEYDAWK